MTRTSNIYTMQRTQIICLLIWLNLNISESTGSSNEETKWVRIKHNTGLMGPIAESNLPGNTMILNGKIKLASEKCCPLIFIGHYPMGVSVKDGCLNMTLDSITLLQGRTFYLLDWKLATYRTSMNCEYHDDKNYTCYFDELTETTGNIGVGKVYLFYPCFTRQSVDVLIDIRLKGRNISFPETNCLELGLDSPCKKYYNYSSLPNIYGRSTYEDAQSTMAALQLTVTPNCHKYAGEFLCHSSLPKCENQEQIVPCKSTCVEIFSVCIASLGESDSAMDLNKEM